MCKYSVKNFQSKSRYNRGNWDLGLLIKEIECLCGFVRLFYHDVITMDDRSMSWYYWWAYWSVYWSVYKWAIVQYWFILIYTLLSYIKSAGNGGVGKCRRQMQTTNPTALPTLFKCLPEVVGLPHCFMHQQPCTPRHISLIFHIH